MKFVCLCCSFLMKMTFIWKFMPNNLDDADRMFYKGATNWKKKIHLIFTYPLINLIFVNVVFVPC